ncbi:PhzF family phenazine biosynthesis isomerase [Dactylosporangium sp. CA-139066]|uniref:PhzF family phenazine biosynthesis isomerase n=1 Tax=Dactylosporangium sp. CA-139066 TaxID=3239930 RepID=UPI003D8C7E19
MTEIEFAYVDVFATAPLTGAPLTLVPGADGLSDEQMRAVAREFNQSETTFIQRPTTAGATWRLRSFTPSGAEVFGAGHNALGAWLWLAASGRVGDGDFTQQIGPDVLPVYVRGLFVTVEQSPPVFGAIAADREGLAAALGLDVEDLAADRPAQVVSTGAGHLLVPVRDRAAVGRAAPDAGRLVAALRAVGGEGCYVYTHDTVDPAATAHARFFNPAMGIAEDPATGTAAGPLAALLSAGGVVVIEQGHAMGRPSTITVTVAGDRVRVTGSGRVVARGTMTVADAEPVTADEEGFLRRAIGLAARSRAAGDAPFGSLLVGPGGEVLAEEHNTVRSDDDITAHPELKLARWAARNLDAAAAAGTTMYTSCQPCGMCAGAIDRSGLGRVVYALSGAQLEALQAPGGGRSGAGRRGPALFEEARAVLEGYYS